MRRETYVGPWLPEPLLATADDPGRDVERAETLSLALLKVLDRLAPVERAVFLLREVFDYPYEEVSRVVDRRIDHCRQIAHRARKRVRRERPRIEADPAEHERLLSSFLAATEAGDLAALEAMLSEDVVLLSDGGGKKPAALNPIRGPNRVARFMVGVRRKFGRGMTVTLARANGLPAALVHREGRLESVLALDVRDGRIHGVFSVRNPDKLPDAPPA